MDNDEKMIAQLMVRINQKQNDEPYIESSVDGDTIDIAIAFSEMVAHLSNLGIPKNFLLTAFINGIEHSKQHSVQKKDEELMA